MGTNPPYYEIKLKNHLNSNTQTNSFINNIDTYESSKLIKKNKLANLKSNKDNNCYFEKEDINSINLPEIRKYIFVKELGVGAFGKVNLYKERRNPEHLIAVKEFSGITEENFPKKLKKKKIYYSK